MTHKVDRKTLYTTVAISAIILNVVTVKDTVAQVTINYTGTLKEYADLPTSDDVRKSLYPVGLGNQSGNTVTISDGSDNDFASVYNVWGGYSNSFDPSSGTTSVSDNSVVILGGTIVASVYGGEASSGTTINVNNNRVDISGGSIGSNVFGGFGQGDEGSTVNVLGNNVNISGGTINSPTFDNEVKGGFGYGNNINSAIISGNSVVVIGSVFDGAIRGGEYGSAIDGHDKRIITNDNTILISGSTVSGAYGGFVDALADVVFTSGNSIIITEGSELDYVMGAHASNFQNVTNDTILTVISANNVTISNSNIVHEVYGADGYGSGTLTMNDNSVEISGRSTVGDNVYGSAGYSHGDNVTLSLRNNSVVISGMSTVGGDVFGSYGIGGVGGTITVTGNSVHAIGGTISGIVYGGYGDVYNTGSTIVSGNSVVVSGGVIKSNIYGGYIKSEGVLDGHSFTAANITFSVTNNTVTLENGTTVSGDIYGGYADHNGIGINDWNTVVSGNTLNLNGYSGSVKGIYNFENYNWILPKSVASGDAIVSINGEVPVDLTGTKHTIAMYNDGNLLKAGDQVVLIDGVASEAAPISVPTQVNQGHFISYDVNVGVTDEQFVLDINDVSANPNSKAYLEGRAAALGFVSQGSDLIATAGIDYIRTMVRKDAERKGLPLIPFMIMQGSSNRYKTGSHADIDGFNMATGLATGGEFGQGNKVTAGAFFEYGRGNYDTYNNFNSGYVHGSGDVNYTGGGIFGRLDFAGTGLGRVANLTPTQTDGFYVEASLRGGRVSMGFDSNDLTDAEGFRGNYNSKSRYLGGHASAGYVFNFDEQNALDVYARALWTRMNGDTVSVGKDTLHFDRSTSSRVQLSGRYSYVYNDQFKPYLGAAYEYEFKGDIGAKAYDLHIYEPSLKGSTGIVEAGFTFMPDTKTPDFSINLNAQAFFGQRQGGSGQVKLKYQF